MFYFSFLCKPQNNYNSNIEAICLVNYADPQGGEFIAKKYIENAGYNILYPITEAQEINDIENIQNLDIQNLYIDAKENDVAVYIIESITNDNEQQ